MSRVTTRSETASVAAGLVLFLAAGVAETQPSSARAGWNNESPLTVQVGGGVTNFTEQGTRTVTDPGVQWTARGLLMVDRHFGAELGYLGSAPAADIAGVGDAAVLGNGMEILVRGGRRFDVGRLVHVSPYATAGAGVSVFSLVGADRDVPRLRDDDGVFTLPLGLGVEGGYERFSLDLRFMYRPAFGEEMFTDVYEGGFSDGLNSLAFTAALGYSF